MRFKSLILEPGRIWSDHLVVDLETNVVMARCSQERDADAIAAALNKCVVRGETRLLDPPPIEKEVCNE